MSVEKFDSSEEVGEQELSSSRPQAKAAARKYDRGYANEEWGSPERGPRILVSEIPKYKQRGSVLDIGAGQGRDALFLGKQGFSVTALDVSREGLRQIEKHAKAAGLEITTIFGDVANTEIDIGKYDVLVAELVLHHIPRQRAEGLLREWQDGTPVGAIHAIEAITTAGDFYREQKDEGLFYPKPGELAEMYNGWEILVHNESTVTAHKQKPDETPMRNTTTLLLARKPGNDKE